jgi:hypothetical protein
LYQEKVLSGGGCKDKRKKKESAKVNESSKKK